MGVNDQGSWLWLLLSLNGRIGRQPLIIAGLILGVAQLILEAIGGLADLRPGAAVVTTVALLWYPNFSTVVKRCHDLGRSAWASLWVMVPVALATFLGAGYRDSPNQGSHLDQAGLVAGLVSLVGLVSWIIFAVKRGKAGANKFGPGPVKTPLG
jgi:uncharacterized membrane protein YhaH (DUF805 family)